jgi:P-type Ca2+ transporter type 2C
MIGVQEKHGISETNLYHTLPAAEVLSRMEGRPQGLSDAEAAERLERFGKNELQEGQQKTLVGMFLHQFKDVMIIILLIAAAIAGLMGEVTDTAIIAAVVLINAVLGVAQESKAERALAALKKMSAPFAKVRRQGNVSLLKTEDIVPGDIVLVEAGDYIPADMRLLEAASLKIEEAALTGESVPVDKIISALEVDDTMVGDRYNMAYLGTSVTYGRGTGIITATGMDTEVGQIADQINRATIEETPLQKKLAELGKYLSIIIVIIAAAIFAAGILQDRDILEMFLTAVSLAVAAIPEGLPAIVTIVLALGVQKMARQNAIIRRLSAVETLGSTEVICSDKTGTLTLNQMTVRELYWHQHWASNKGNLPQDKTLEIMMQVMTLCNDSKTTRIDPDRIQVLGDPTETALIYFSFEKGFYPENLEDNMPRIAELPFDSERKLMTTVNMVAGIPRIMTKGAPDVLVRHCSQILVDGEPQPLDDAALAQINQAHKNMAFKALRVLAMAYKDTPGSPDDLDSGDLENELIFLGLVGMIDPPRLEAREAVRICKAAGIKAVMITGDHRDTATAIARELGIIDDDSEVLTGHELDRISETDFLKRVSKYSVYARVSPEHKVRIVRAWKHNGKVVAMTGDGVNDAPALKAADIGVGMGITGTDVSKGVSDMVLADDNFATIVLAVEEGRKIYNNIRKAIQFLLSANTGEILTLFIATMLNWTILYPIHILWINLVTDTFPALALGLEEGETGIMKQKPRPSSASIFADGLGANIVYQGLLQALITLTAYYFGIRYYNQPIAITMAFATLGFIQVAHAFNVRSSHGSVFRMGLFTNPYLLGASLLSASLMVAVILIPGLSGLFRVTSLSLAQWGIVVGLSVLIIPLVELIKLGRRLLTKK